MSLHIAGMGWVTPLGRGLEKVWDRLLRGEEAAAQKVSRGAGEPQYPTFLVPKDELGDLPPHPRLRRASPISRFAAAAGLDALETARSAIGEIDATRIALIFAISNGGVIYTARFYGEVVKSGAQSASPLLFPETVFNASASHLAAILGITGASYTLVGDGAVGMLALKMAENLMTDERLDCCLIVGAEEVDWLLCDAYRRWRLLKSRPPIEPFRAPPKGTVLSEGAGAVVLGRKGPVAVDQIHGGTNFWRRNQAAAAIVPVLSNLTDARAKLLISSANGTFVDLAEMVAIHETIPDACVYSCKPALGESVGASALWQVIVAGQSLLSGKQPPLLHLATKDSPGSAEFEPTQSALVLSCGMNQQVAGLRLSI
ncbi:MAG TPA: beta-ketoacyl synthase N-terminal-like domain-containing protein [Chthoniobacterales bacterium]|nr:beta-ketoacyl synthase N-terminal-like domain-containing protein [Chthoniobacterales bacterium]